MSTGPVVTGRLRGTARAMVACAAVAALGLPGTAAAAAVPGGGTDAAAAPAAGGTPTRPRYPATEDLHDPGVVSRSAYVNRRFTPRRHPSLSARTVGQKLGLLTEDRTTELVLVLARTSDAAGRTWLQVRTPSRPNGTVGWVPGDALGTMHRVATWLKVDLATTTLTLVRSGKVVFRARVGVGRKKWPTPRGEFYVRNALSGRALGPIYGPLAFGLSAHSDVLTDWPGGGVVGIHGTNEPGLIPGRISHGCIRLRNSDILRLGRMLPIGTPVTIT